MTHGDFLEERDIEQFCDQLSERSGERGTVPKRHISLPLRLPETTHTWTNLEVRVRKKGGGMVNQLVMSDSG